WYEDMRHHMHLDPIAFAYDYMMRGGKVNHKGLRRKAPKFIAAYEAYAGPARKGRHSAIK
ncbi:MAG: monooxygenase, partial [Candidatus Binatota bacterium]